MIPFISFDEGEAVLDWIDLTDAIATGHTFPKAEIGDTFLYRGSDTLLSRAAWIDGLGIAVKSATVFPGNPASGKPAINGGLMLYSNTDGTPDAIIDFHLVTKWKTVGDSLLAARKLARKDSENILIVGAGTVAHALHAAYQTLFPGAKFSVWNRSKARGEAMADALGMSFVNDLATAVDNADIIACATMTTEPLIKGSWLKPGQHLDLIGAYRPDMREVDDATLQRAKIYVDSFETTVDHIGEIKIPLGSGAIQRQDLIADYYDLDAFTRGPDDITLFKNGGGAHLDLMTARHILERWQA